MKQLLENRIAFITLLLGAFGGAFTLIPDLDFEDTTLYKPVVIIALSSICSLIVSLLLSLSLKKKKDKEFNERISKRGWRLFFSACFFLVAFFVYLLTHTVSYDLGQDRGKYKIIAGIQYSETAASTLKDHPSWSKEELLSQFGGPGFIDQVWSVESRKFSELILVILYCTWTILCAAAISILVEELARKRRRQPETKKEENH